MIDLNRSGRTTSWRFVRVRRVCTVPSDPDYFEPYYEEIGEIRGIDPNTLSIEESTESSLKISGSFDYSDMEDIGDDLLRVYADLELDGETETICYGTFLVQTGKETICEGSRSGSADMYSVLSILDRELLTTPVSVDASVPPMYWVKDAMIHLNVPYVLTPSEKTVSSAYAFDRGVSFLEMINDCLEMIGYASANVDAYGNVILKPYVSVSDKEPTTYFSDTLDDVSDAEIEREFDTYDVPNHVVVYCDKDDETTVSGEALNKDPNNPYSTVSRKMVITRVESVEGLETDEECKAKAELLLREGMQKVETLIIPHAGKRFAVGDAVKLDYRRSNLEGKYNAYKRTIEGTPDIASETTIRRTVNLYDEL